MNATISKNEIAVRPRTRDDDGSHWLVIDVPNGWDDVKKISKKVLIFEGRKYVFMSWNSDRLECSFKESANIAKFA